MTEAERELQCDAEIGRLLWSRIDVLNDPWPDTKEELEKLLSNLSQEMLIIHAKYFPERNK